jgi:hypothetical protein
VFKASAPVSYTVSTVFQTAPAPGSCGRTCAIGVEFSTPWSAFTCITSEQFLAPQPVFSLQLRRGVEFATACGAFTCTKPGAIDAQPTAAEAEALLADKGRVAQ